MAEASPFDQFDEAPAQPSAGSGSPFDQFDTPMPQTAAALDQVPDQTLPEVTVTGHKPPSTWVWKNQPAAAPSAPEASWGETAGAVLPTIGARIESKLAGLQEFTGKSEYADAQKKYWQSMILPGAVREAKDAGIALTDHPDVISNAQRLGIRPDVFSRDWPDYVNMAPKDLEDFQAQQRQKIDEGQTKAVEGIKRRTLAGQVSADVRPQMSDWSPKSIVFDSLTGIPDLLVGAAGTVAGGPAVGMGAMMASIAPEQWSEAKKQGLDDRRAGTYAALSSLAFAAPEVPVLKIVGGGAAGSSLLRKLVGDTVGQSAAGKVAGTAVTQGVSQSVIQALQEGIDSGVIDKDTTLSDALSRIARAGLIGTTMGAPLGALHAGMTRAPKPTTLKDITETGGGAQQTAPEAAIERQPTASVQPQPTEAPAEAEKRTTPEAGAQQPDTRAALEALKDQSISPPQMEHLESLGLARRNDVGVPMILPAGRRALVELQKEPQEAAPAAKPEEKPEAAAPAAVPEAATDELTKRLASDQDLRAELERMKGETGWAQVGGRLMRTGVDPESGETGHDRGPVKGRTEWIPNAEWWRDRPKGLTEDQVHLAVDKALNGEPLGKRETAMVQHMVDTADAPKRAFQGSLEQARSDTETSPTDAQKAAGNYAKGELQFAPGLTFTMENPKGSTRTGTGEGGKPWQRTMEHDYGYLNRTEGADGEHVDAFLTGKPDTGKVFVVNQVDPKTGKFDETKSVLGADSEKEARATYQANYPKGWEGAGSVVELSTDAYREWLRSGDHSKPLGATATPEQGGIGRRAAAAQDEYAARREELHQAVPELGQQSHDAVDLTVLISRAGDRDAKAAAKVVDSWEDDHPDTIARVRAELQQIIHRGEETPIKAEARGAREPEAPKGAPRGEKEGEARVEHARLREDQAEYTAAHPVSGGRGELGVEEGRGVHPGPTLSLFGPEPAAAAPASRAEPVAKPVRPASSNLQLFGSDEAPAPSSARTQTHTGLIETGRFHSGIKQVKRWQDAAHILAPLRKSPQESLMALAVDAKGRPLAVLRHSIGNQSGAPAVPHLIVGAVSKIEGAAGVYFGHNHPSGLADQSTADILITQKLHDLMRGSGIDPLGMIVVTPGGVEASFYHPGHGGADSIPGKTTAAPRTKSGAVPVVERRFTRLPAIEGRGKPIRSPRDAVKAVEASGEKSGVMLLDNRHHVAAVLPMHQKEMSVLRTGDKSSGALHVMRAIEDSNANAAITFGPEEMRGSLANLGRMISDSGVKLHDTLLKVGEEWQPQAERGTTIESRTSFYARREGEGPGLQRPEVERVVRAAVRDSGMRAAPDFPHVEVHQDFTTLPPDLRAKVVGDGSQETAGAVYDPQTGQIHMIADNLGTPREAVETLWHEAVGHHGLRLIMDSDRYGKVMDGIWNAMPDRVRQTAERNGLDVNQLAQRRMAAEEVIAYAAGKHLAGGPIDNQIRPYWQRALQAVRAFFSRISGKPFTTDEDIARVIAESKRALESGSGLQRMGDVAASQRAAAFYSPVERAVINSKQGKASAEQWLATLSKTPGIKPEELEWLNLAPWLKEHKGAVTREELADYVRANKLELEETHLGSNDEAPSAHEISQTHHAEALRAIGASVDIYPDGSLDQVVFTPHGGDTLQYVASEIDADKVQAERVLARMTPEMRMRVQALHEASRLVEREQQSREVFGNVHGAQYQEFTLPGGENYKEVLLRLPTDQSRAQERLTRADNAVRSQASKELMGNGRDYALDVARGDLSEHQVRLMSDAMRPLAAELRAAYQARRGMISNVFHSAHWDEPNVLAHVRTKDRVDADGKKTLFLEELQSDWHQAGRERGYQSTTPAEGLRAEEAEDGRYWKVVDKDGEFVTNVYRTQAVSAQDAIEEAARRIAQQPERTSITSKPPQAPLKTSWPMLIMKRMIRAAAEGGHERIAWTTGQQQAERYSLEKHVKAVRIWKDLTRPGDYRLNVWDNNDRIVVPDSGSGWLVGSPDVMRQYVGKELAEKAMAEVDRTGEAAHYTGLDLKVGGEGMRGFYDDILPRETNKLIGKYGAKVGDARIPEDMGGYPWATSRPRSVVMDPGHGWLIRMENGVTSGTWPDKTSAEHALGVQQKLYDEQAANPRTLPAHGFDITPQMREQALSQGFPMFWKKPSQQTLGLQHEQGPKWYEAVRRAVTYLHDNPVTRDMRKLINPTKLSEEAKRTAVLARAALGSLAHQTFETQEHLEQFSREIDKLKPEEQLEMMGAIEHGVPQPNADLQPVADALRQQLDTWRDKVRGLGTGALDNFIENYFPHYWSQPNQAQRMIATIMGRRPLRGPASFLKMRTIPTIKEGMDAGLTPLTINPLVMTLLKVREMQRFVSGVKMMQSFKDAGLAKFLPATKPMPDGWAEIKDNIAKVRQWSEEEQGFIERGRYIMPEDGARLINNHVGRSVLSDFAPTYVLRLGGNLLNAMQLGFSAFHLGFTTLDASISKNALAIERLVHGEPGRAAAAFAEGMTPAGAIMNVRRGFQLMKAYADPSGATPEMAQIVKALEVAGGRTQMDRYYMAIHGVSPFRGVGIRSLAGDIRTAMKGPEPLKEVGRAVASFPQEYAVRAWRELQGMTKTMPLLQVPFEIAGRTVRASTSWIMEHLVPMQKLGVFSDLAQDYLRRNPSATSDQVAAAMQSAWDSVDNRLGEMVYDNVFWNRTFKDANHLAVRAVGWNLGTIREIGGAPLDVLKGIDKLARDGKVTADDLGHKIPYVLAMTMTTAALGATINYMFTGQGPQELKDYFFPRTGGTTTHGTPQRLSLPSYVKDVYEYSQRPTTTITNKLNPIFGVLADIWRNQDYFGNPISEPEASGFTQAGERAAFAARQATPFSVQGTKMIAGSEKPGAAGAVKRVLPFIGVTPAPGYVTSAEQLDRRERYEAEDKYSRELRYKLNKAVGARDTDAVKSLTDEYVQSRRRVKELQVEMLKDKAKAAASRRQNATSMRQQGYPATAELVASLPLEPDRAARDYFKTAAGAQA